MKKIIGVILSIAIIAVLGISAVAEENVLKVGMEGTYAPYTYHDDAGALTGFEVDVATAIGEKIGYQVEFVEGAWDSLFPALDAGTIDVIMNQVTITEARLETYDFSTPYVYTRPVLIVAADNEDITTFDDLAPDLQLQRHRPELRSRDHRAGRVRAGGRAGQGRRGRRSGQ